MPLNRPSELHAFLTSLGIHPKRGLSQNFLVDGNIIRNIVKVADLQKDDIVLEVGPGPGALTEELLKNQVKLLAVELDRTLAAALPRLGPVTVFEQDILEFDLERNLDPLLQGGKRAKMVANLPYHLTTPIITQFAPQNERFSHLILMVQHEVARRFCSSPGTKEFGSISIFLQFYCNPKTAFTVSKNCFYPKPKVDSAVIVLELKKPPDITNTEQFFSLVRHAYQERRKMLRASLKDIVPPEVCEEAILSIGQRADARPEVLSLADWLGFYEQVKNF